MDALYPRLLVRDFPASVAFYRAALGLEPVKVLEEAAYANWDIDGQAGLTLFGRQHVADVVGTADLPPAGQDTVMLVMRVDDVDGEARRFAGLGATVVAPPRDRPEWGPGLRTAHLRDPEGNLIELQSY
ncbi:MAG: glyoxalase/bleomycin resistance/extradiol dioxygenase family protein [Thermoactinospora sp.]|nr:glyoxalase/bleomycin resistance/extradiol dioxygenase family protein [Thermoactinospora sp.]